MKIRELDDTELSGFDSERRWLSDNLRRFGDEFLLRKTPDDIPTLQSLLDVEPFASGDEGSLEVLGAALGDIICAALDMRWIVVEDEHGIDFAIQHRDLAVFAFPRDMIVKRVEAGDLINLTELCNGVIAALREQIAQHQDVRWSRA